MVCNSSQAVWEWSTCLHVWLVCEQSARSQRLHWIISDLFLITLWLVLNNSGQSVPTSLETSFEQSKIGLETVWDCPVIIWCYSLVSVVCCQVLWDWHVTGLASVTLRRSNQMMISLNMTGSILTKLMKSSGDSTSGSIISVWYASNSHCLWIHAHSISPSTLSLAFMMPASK